MDSEFMVRLESLVDEASLVQVLETLSEICHAKAEHLETNWQDAASGKVWTAQGKLIEKLVSRMGS